MKWMIPLLFASTVALADRLPPTCKQGYKQTDVYGVCIEINQDEVNPMWVSDEPPPQEKMPSYQREGVTIVNAPNMAAEDERMDKERLDAEQEGRKRAGIRSK